METRGVDQKPLRDAVPGRMDAPEVTLANSREAGAGSQHLTPDGPPCPEQAGLPGAPRPVPCGRARCACRSGLSACAQRGAEPLIAMESAEAEPSESRPEEDGAVPASDLPLPEQPAATVRCGGWRGAQDLAPPCAHL